MHTQILHKHILKIMRYSVNLRDSCPTKNYVTEKAFTYRIIL